MQSFITIGLPFEELSCIQVAGHTDRHLQSGPGPGPGPVGTGTGSGPKFQVLTGPGRDRDQNFIFYRDRDGTKISSWSRKCF